MKSLTVKFFFAFLLVIFSFNLLFNTFIYGKLKYEEELSWESKSRSFQRSVRDDLLSNNLLSLKSKALEFIAWTGISCLEVNSKVFGGLLHFPSSRACQGVSKSIPLAFSNIFFDSERTSEAASLRYYKSEHDSIFLKRPLLIYFNVLFFITIISIIVFRKILLSKIDFMFQSFVSLAETHKTNLDSVHLEEISKIDSNLGKYISLIIEKVNELSIQRDKVRNAEIASEINKKIAHDIRSPLAALRVVSDGLDEIDPLEKQLIKSSIMRINEIATGLLDSDQIERKKIRTLVNMRIILEDLIFSKGIISENKIDMQVKGSYADYFLYGNETLIFRACSNIVNNALESGIGASVKVLLSLENGKIIIDVLDNGVGMTSDFIKEVLKGGVSTKRDGNGIGLSSSNDIIVENGGTLRVSSQIGEGTKVQIKFPAVKSPKWFCERIQLDKGLSCIRCYDDDNSFLKLYEETLRVLNASFEVKSSGYPETDLVSQGEFYFFDYDLKQEKSGLDFIVDYKVQRNSILVTSEYSSDKLQKACSRHNLRMIPKQIFSRCEFKLK